MWIRPQDSTRPRRAFLQEERATEHRQQTTALVGHSLIGQYEDSENRFADDRPLSHPSSGVFSFSA